MRTSLIAALASENRVIGKDGRLPWHLPADLAHFQRTTRGHTLVLGRRTWEGTGLLKDRRMVVLTRDRDYRAEGADVVHSLDEAVALARRLAESDLFIGGGEGIFREALPWADRLVLTLVHGHFEGDTVFPEFDESAWRLRSRTDRPADEANPHDLSFLVYERPRDRA